VISVYLKESEKEEGEVEGEVAKTSSLFVVMCSNIRPSIH